MKQYKQKYIEILKILKSPADIEQFEQELANRLIQLDEYNEVYQMIKYMCEFLKDVSKEIGIFIIILETLSTSQTTKA